MDRRTLLKGIGAGSMLAWLPANAAINEDKRFVLVILRGALDGLALLPPVGDKHYAGLRGELALARAGEESGVLPVNDLFGLHPAMPNLHRQFGNGDALFVHAVSSPYRERSHFDGQDVLERGTVSFSVSSSLGSIAPLPPKMSRMRKPPGRSPACARRK